MQYNGLVDAVRRMLADEGIAGFYKGGRCSCSARLCIWNCKLQLGCGWDVNMKGSREHKHQALAESTMTMQQA
jgi:hypothetical protein